MTAIQNIYDLIFKLLEPHTLEFTTTLFIKRMLTNCKSLHYVLDILRNTYIIVLKLSKLSNRYLTSNQIFKYNFNKIIQL